MPGSPPKQHFTSINSERLAMLDAGEESEEEIIQESTYARGKGENAVELPFNRLEMTKNTKEMEVQAKNFAEDEFRTSEEE